MGHNLEETARALVAPGKGILAADESSGTIKKRFDSIGVESTEDSRRAYRDMLFTTDGAADHISGVILYDETIRQSAHDGTPFPKLLEGQGVIPGIKVDMGAKALAHAPGEKITEGLDGLRERLAEYVGLGARFTKWRAVITIGEGIPSEYCLWTNAHALARYAALSQEAGLVPIVEPEVLMDGNHSIESSFDVTSRTLHAVFTELRDQRVHFEQMLLKPNMVLSGYDASGRAGIQEVADADDPVLPAPRSGGRSRDRVPLRRTDRRGRHRPPECDERDGPASVGAVVLVWAGAPGAGTEGMGRRRGERLGRTGRVPAAREAERPRPLGELLAGDGDRGRRLSCASPASAR